MTFQQQLLQRVAALPGVEAAGMTSDLPWTGYDENAGFTIEGKTFPPNKGPGGRYHFVSDDYFRAVGVPLLTGRFLNADDKRDKRPVVLINRSLADRYWAHESAIGQRITFNSEPKEKDWLTVIGIVGDVKDAPNSTAAVPAFYFPLLQHTFGDVILAVRTRASQSEMARVLHTEVAVLDKNLALASIRTLETIADTAVAPQRLTLMLFATFALTALVLAAIGIYGVLSYLIAQRTREIGIRMAVGAVSRDVIWLAIKQGMKPTLVGVAVGLACAFALTRLMSSLLFGVGATDLATFSLSALLLTLVAFLASWLPGRRAARVDPVIALRAE
jgi:predicted permease